jgi:UDP:flavonoid glycosyltransferase YjiC (YdhE family)
MRRVAFLMLPEPGHILPSLRVAQEMQKLGFEIAYISPWELRDYFEHRGFEHHSIFQNVRWGSGQKDILQTSPAASWYKAVGALATTSYAKLPQLLASELRRLPFDALVCDGTIAHAWGKVIADAIGKPMVSLSMSIPDPEADDGVPVPEIILCPQEFDLPDECTRPSRIHRQTLYAESSIPVDSLRRDADGAFQLPPNVVYCSLGTQTHRYSGASALFKRIVEAFICSQYNLIVSCANQSILSCNATYPPNVTVVPVLEPIEILRHARLFITHGGLGSLKEAIINTVPLLVIPFDLDQPRNAERVVHHKLGAACLPPECTVYRIRQLVECVINESEIHIGLGQMGAIFLQREREAPAARMIAKCISG